MVFLVTSIKQLIYVATVRPSSNVERFMCQI